VEFPKVVVWRTWWGWRRLPRNRVRNRHSHLCTEYRRGDEQGDHIPRPARTNNKIDVRMQLDATAYLVCANRDRWLDGGNGCGRSKKKKLCDCMVARVATVSPQGRAARQAKHNQGDCECDRAPTSSAETPAPCGVGGVRRRASRRVQQDSHSRVKVQNVSVRSRIRVLVFWSDNTESSRTDAQISPVW
jgi:hypothetical protein